MFAKVCQRFHVSFLKTRQITSTLKRQYCINNYFIVRRMQQNQILKLTGIIWIKPTNAKIRQIKRQIKRLYLRGAKITKHYRFLHFGRYESRSMQSMIM